MPVCAVVMRMPVRTVGVSMTRFAVIVTVVVRHSNERNVVVDVVMAVTHPRFGAVVMRMVVC